MTFDNRPYEFYAQAKSLGFTVERLSNDDKDASVDMKKNGQYFTFPSIALAEYWMDGYNTARENAENEG